MCAAFTGEFKTASKSRKSEIALLGELKDYVLQQKAQFDDSSLKVAAGAVFDKYKKDFDKDKAKVDKQDASKVLAQLVGSFDKNQTEQMKKTKKQQYLRRK